jgi:hypothetical protein
MSHYVYGEVNANCDVHTMKRVLENMVPEWKGKIDISDAGDIKLGSGYQQAKDTYHIRVKRGTKGISYEDFGMRKAGDKWMIAMGGHSNVAGKLKKQFEEELPGELGRYQAKKIVDKLDIFGLAESEEDDDFIIDFTATSADDLLDMI